MIVRRPRDSVDPEASILLLSLVGFTVVGLIVSLAIGSAALRDVVLKGAGGALLVVGSYYAARTLMENRADQRAAQMLRAIELTAHPSAAVRSGAVGVLIEIAESSADREVRRLETISSVLKKVRAEHEDDELLTESALNGLEHRAAKARRLFDKRHRRGQAEAPQKLS